MGVTQVLLAMFVSTCMVVLSVGAPAGIANNVERKMPADGERKCDWGCRSDIDHKLQTCVARCLLDFPRGRNFQYSRQNDCQGVCANMYLNCYEGCGQQPSMNMT